MKIDRFVKVMLVLIALLLALNCAKDINLPSNNSGSGNSVGTSNTSDRVSNPTIFENTVEAATPPSFLQVGKSYLGVIENSRFEFKALEIQNSGWVKIQLVKGNIYDEGETVWLNPSGFLYIKETK